MRKETIERVFADAKEKHAMDWLKSNSGANVLILNVSLPIRKAQDNFKEDFYYILTNGKKNIMMFFRG